MAGNNDLNIALKITADLSEGQQALKSINNELKATGDTATAEEARIAASAKAVEQTFQSIADYQNKAANTKKTSVFDSADIEEQQAALQKLLNAIDPVEKKLSRLDEFEQQLKESRKSGAIGIEEYQQALAKIESQRDRTSDNTFDSQSTAIQRLLSEIDPLEKKLARLDELEQRLNYQFQTGAVDTETYNSALEKINQQRDKAVQTAEKQRTAEDSVAVAARQAALETEKQQAATQRLLAEIDPLAGKLNKLVDQERRLNEAYKNGSIDAETYAHSLQKIKQQRDHLNQGLSNTDTGVLSSGVSKIAGPLLAAFSVKEITRRSDAFKDLNNRMRTVTSSTEALSYASNRANEAASASLRPLESTAELYQRIATNGGKLKLTYNDIGKLTETINKTVGMSGLREGLANSTIEQIGRIYAAGTLKQTQFNRILRQTPEFAQAIADGMDITVEALMTLSSKGKIELDDITQALQKQADTVSVKFAATETTMSQAFGTLTDSLTVAIGKLDSATGASNAFAQGMLNVAGAINQLSNAPMDFFRSAENMQSAASIQRAISAQRAEIAQMEKEQAEYNKKGGLFTNTAKSYQPRIDNLKAEEQKLQQQLKNASGANSPANQIPEAKGGTAYNEQLEAYVNRLDKARVSVGKLTKEEEAREAIKSGSLGKVSPDDEKRVIDAAKLADQTKDQTVIETNLANLRKSAARADSQNAQQGIIEYEIKNGWLKNATKAEQDEARAIAKKTDEQRKSNGATNKSTADNERYVKSLTDLARKRSTAPAAIRAEEIATRALSAAQYEQALAAHSAITDRENTQQNLELQIQLWRATGQTGAASAAEIEDRYKQLFETLEQSGNTAGLALAKANKSIELAKIPLSDAQSSIDKVLAEQSRQEQSIQAQQQAGLISSYTAREKLLELHRATRIELEKQIPVLEEAAAKTGDPAIAERLANIKQQVQELGLETNIWLSTLQTGIESGLSSAFNGLITNTMNLREALNALAQGIVQQFAQMASQNLANIISSGVGNLFSGMMDTGADTAAKTAADTAGSSMYATAITTSTTAGAAALGATLNASFTAGAAQIAAAMQVGAASSGVGAAAGAAFASGGAVYGPGTGTSDSITAKLSNGEYVVRAASVKRYGINFLHAINTQQVKHFADGGAVSPIAAPTSIGSSSSLSAPSAATSQQSAPVIQQTLVLDAGEAFTTGLSTTAGNRSMMTFIQANKQTIKQELDM